MSCVIGLSAILALYHWKETPHSVNCRNHSLLALIGLTSVAYLLRVIGAESSVIYSHHPQLVRQSLELGQSLLANSNQSAANQGGVKNPLTLTLFLTGVYGVAFVVGQLGGAFDSMAAFRDFLFANREAIYLLAVLALNFISVCLIPAIFFAQKALNRAHTGWLAGGLAAFNLLLVQFGHQPRPHVPYATIAFCASVLLVLAAHRVGGWKMLIAASILSAMTVGSLQSGILIIATFLLAHASRLFHGGKFHLRALVSAPTIASLAMFAALCLLLYPDFIGEYGRVVLDSLSGASARFELGAGSHFFSLGMLSTDNISQFVSHLQSYHPLLTLILPLALIYFIVVLRRQPRLLLVGLSFPLLNLIVWSLFYGAFPRITAILVPFMIFAAAYLIEDVALKLSEKRGIGLRQLRALAFAVMLLPLTLTSLRLVWVTAQSDTRSLALDYINDNIPTGANILLSFPFIKLLPTDEAIDRQVADFPASIGTHWQWLRGQEDISTPRYNIFNKLYWYSQSDSIAAKSDFIETAGIRYVVIRTQASRPAGDEITTFAQANGRLILSFCPAYAVEVAQLPDDMFYHAWLQVWQVKRPGPIVALYDLRQPPADPPVKAYCRSET